MTLQSCLAAWASPTQHSHGLMASVGCVALRGRGFFEGQKRATVPKRDTCLNFIMRSWASSGFQVTQFDFFLFDENLLFFRRSEAIEVIQLIWVTFNSTFNPQIENHWSTSYHTHDCSHLPYQPWHLGGWRFLTASHVGHPFLSGPGPLMFALKVEPGLNYECWYSLLMRKQEIEGGEKSILKVQTTQGTFEHISPPTQNAHSEWTLKAPTCTKKIICSLLESERERKWIRWKTVRFIPWRHPHKPEWRLSDLTKEKVQAQAGYTMTPTSKQIISVRNWAPLFHQMHTLHRIHPRPVFCSMFSCVLTSKTGQSKRPSRGRTASLCWSATEWSYSGSLTQNWLGAREGQTNPLKIWWNLKFPFPRILFLKANHLSNPLYPPQLMCAHICEWP